LSTVAGLGFNIFFGAGTDDACNEHKNQDVE